MAHSNPKGKFSMECKPKLLKDFLNDYPTYDLGSYPRKPSRQVVQHQQLVAFERSKSRAATSTISAIHKASEIVIKTLKYLSFPSHKSSPLLPRSISGKLSSGSGRKEKDDNRREITPVNVKVKDILRWRSSRDLAVEESTQLDLCYSPDRCTIDTATSVSTSCSSPLTSTSSSWCESDFSAENFPSWCYASGENEMDMTDKKFSPQKADIGVGEIILEKTDEAEDQYTPVSVLASPFQEDNELTYTCRFANIQSMSQISKFKGQEKQVNGTEEKAEQLLHHLTKTTLSNSYDSLMQDNLLMDFFWEELSTSQKDENSELLESQLIATAEDWLRGVQEGGFEWAMDNGKENYVREMEMGLKWNKHEEEKEEMALQLEKLVLNSLVDEILFGLITL